MLYRLEVPQLAPDVRFAVVDRWHCTEGSEIDFGDPVCDLVVTRRDIRARRGQPNRMVKDERSLDVMVERDADMRIRLISSDTGIIRRLDASPGADVTVGTSLGLASSEPGEPLTAPADLAFRLIVDLTPGSTGSTPIEAS